MSRHGKLVLASIPALLGLPFTATAQSTPKLDVLVYSFPGISPWVLQEAEKEAARLLRPVARELQWTDCSVHAIDPGCASPRIRSDLIVRFIPRALPQATTGALGIAGPSGGYATAFIFYDRVVALRTQGRPMPVMLGRVLAHEIVHLLLPSESHSEVGLMRGQWSADDLRVASSACLDLPARFIPLMQREAARRIRIDGDRSRAEPIGKRDGGSWARQ